MDVNKIVGSLKYLEGKLGKSPSTKDIAEEAGCSEATAIKYLQRAVAQNIILQRGGKDGKYMTHAVARAFDAQRE
jgi:hypothetical protein